MPAIDTRPCGAHTSRVHLIRSRIEPVPQERRRLREPRHLPMTRGDCVDGPRPCVHVSCRHNLWLDVRPNGNLQLNFPHIAPEDMTHSCALDVAEGGALVPEKVAALLNITRSRVQQIEAEGSVKILDAFGELGIDLRDVLPDATAEAEPEDR